MSARSSRSTPTRPDRPGTAPAGAADAARCLRTAADALVALQHEGGWWKGELETNVTMDAEDLLLREFLGIRTDAQTASAARWIRSRQRADGTWANFYGGPPDLSTTVEAYVALRLAGDPPDAPHMRARAPGSSAEPAAWSAPGSSPASGWRCSACGRGRSCRSCPPS